MSRVLKVRVWDIARKQMFQVSELFFYQTVLVQVNTKERAYSIPDNEVVLIQFTGLCDKHGKEIYEGDIIKTHFDKTDQYNAYDEVGVVESHWNSFSATVIANKKHGINYRPFAHSEILGNIYEQPELVEGR